MAKAKLAPIVEVEWVDSCSGPGWRSGSEAKVWIDEVMTYYVCGYLISKTKKEITVATGFSPRTDRVVDLFQIPRACIKRFRVIRKARRV